MQIRSYVALVSGICLSASVAPAALITGTPISSPTLPADLTTAGTLDWAAWHVTSSTGSDARAPTHKMDKATPSLVSSASAVAGNNKVRGSSTSTNITVAFTNGAGGANTTSQSVAGVFGESLNTAGNGVQIDVTLPEAGKYKVSLWVSGYNGRGTLTAGLPGATSYSDNSFNYVGGGKEARLYELNVTSDTALDKLNLKYVLTTVGSGGSAHTLIAAAAVSAVPEPASLAVLGLVAAGLLKRRRITNAS